MIYSNSIVATDFYKNRLLYNVWICLSVLVDAYCNYFLSELNNC
jgi:hypothetical protein